MAAPPPPWNSSEFFSEIGLKEAQEYFFQTHATHARMIAEGHGAQGYMKTFARRKLSKQIGEDFKMYTGKAIGETGQDSVESMGIRGEMNDLLKNIYYRISPNKPITSPIQEDLAIVKHPFGALEVCFAMVFYYNNLLKKYASFASNHRKVLKSVMDEELFKWIWRLAYTILMTKSSELPDFEKTLSSPSMNYIPPEHQRLNQMGKIKIIGDFLLGTGLAQSHIRFPLCFYFFTYLRQIQSRVLLSVDRRSLEKSYEEICKRSPQEPPTNIVVALDEIMNWKGNSQQTFEEVLRGDETELARNVPPQEIEFLDHFQDFSHRNMKSSLKKFIHQVSKEDFHEDTGATLMPLVMLFRTLPSSLTHRIMERLPGPYLTLIKNRVSFGNADDISMGLAEQLKEVVADRQRGGETYSIRSRGKTSKHSVVTLAQEEKDPPAEKTAAKPAAAEPGQPAAAQPAQPEPQAKAAEPQTAAQTARPQPAAGRVVAPPSNAKGLREARIIVAWRVEDARLNVVSLSPEEVIGYAGAEVRFLGPLLFFALQTGQVLDLPPEKVSRELVQQLLRRLVGAKSESPPRITAKQKEDLLREGKELPVRKFLMSLIEKVGADGQTVRHAGTLTGDIHTLCEKLGEKVGEFLRKPREEAFAGVLKGLSGGEKHTVLVLTRVARIP